MKENYRERLKTMKTKCKSKNLIENKYWKKGVYVI